MKFISKFLIIFFFASISSFPFSSFFESEDDTSTINKMRSLFYEAVEDEERLIELENLIKTNFSDDIEKYSAIVLSYHGGVEALKSKHAFNPYTKLSYLISSLGVLENAVNKDPEDLEIRFMRFSILHHIPSIIGYGKEREDDLNKIFSLLIEQNHSQLNYDIQRGIIQFMLDSERLSSKQFKRLQQLASSMANNE
jgi:hypothetical protein